MKLHRTRAGARAVVVSLSLALVLVGLSSHAASAAGPNDPYYKRQWHLARIGAPTAWKTTKGKGMVIAIVDSGVTPNHEDLKANLTRARFDAFSNDSNPQDNVGHGTGVAGAAAAVMNNRKGVVGVAPSAKIMAVRVANSPTMIDPFDVAEGTKWAADHGADVINLSLGAPIPIGIGEEMIVYATALGALVVVAAGNAAQPFCSSPGFNPAALCVGASNSGDSLASFSNYGARADVVAPGVGIWTTSKFFYGPVNGTSFASPITAGLGALLMSMGANNVLAAAIIRATAKDLGLPGYDITYGFGRIDAKAAVALCKQIC